MALSRPPSLLRQRGFALMLVLLLVSVGLGAAVFSFMNSHATILERDQITTASLASVKTALIAYAVSSNARPGEFPCPDTKAPTDFFYGTQNAACGGAGVALGRVPWKTLGIPEPKDGAGETLWYAVSTRFRTQPATTPINSDTRGDLTVFSPNGVTPLTTEAVAVIFAPGAALGAQTRGGANQNVAANYLETSSGINNADTVAPTGPFIAGRMRDPNNPSYNDRLLYITTREFIPAVEMRVAREVSSALEGYRANSSCGCYPWADTWPLSDSISDRGVNRGRFPLDASPEGWGSGKIPTLPAWLGANEWQDLIFYSVGRQNTDHPLGLDVCDFCSPNATLTVDGKPVSALIFMPGTPRNSGWRIPGPKGQATDNTLSHYLEDAQNNDGGHLDINSVCPTPPELGKTVPYIGFIPPVPASCDTYVTPASTGVDRDRIHTLTSPGVPVSCAQNAASLLALSPCGPPPKLKAQCVVLATNLAACGCSAAANVMINVPCMNTFNPKACQTAVAQLKAC